MYTIAFDCNGTLRNSAVDQSKEPVANEHVRTLLVYFAGFDNVLIHVWSGEGEAYARHVASHIGIDPYVDSYSAKPVGDDLDVQGPSAFEPDISIDNEADNAHLAGIVLMVGAAGQPSA